jgi:hypothetical protein
MSTVLSVLIPSMVSWHGSWVKLTSLEGLLRNDYCEGISVSHRFHMHAETNVISLVVLQASSP